MTPLSLTLIGFGTYSTPFTIEFPTGVFLLCGKNGSGKSTLLRGISYALYGATNSTPLRHSTLSDSDPMTVSLTFTQDQKQYIVTRTEQNNQITALLKSDDIILAENEAVTPYITKLIHHTLPQYQQHYLSGISRMESLLYSTSETRTSILRTLFQTQSLYQKQQETQQLYQSAKLQLETLQNTYPTLPTAETLQEKQQSYEALLTQIETLQKETTQAESQQRQTTRLQAQYQETLSARKVLRTQKAEQEQILSQAVTAMGEAQQRENELTLLQEELTQYPQLEQLNQRIALLQKSYSTCYGTLLLQEQEYSRLTEECAQLEETLAQYNSARTKHQSNIEHSEQLLREQLKLKQLLEQFQELQQLQKNCLTEETTYQQMLSHTDELKTRWESSQKQYYLQQAAELARLYLQENTPCPVCGSTNHPHPAQPKSDVLLSYEALQTLRSTWEKSMEQTTQQQAAWQRASSSVELMQQILAKETESFRTESDSDIEEALHHRIFQIDTELQQLQELLQQGAQQEQKRLNLTARIPYLKGQITQLKAHIETDKPKYDTQKQQLENLQQQYETLASNLTYSSRTETEFVLLQKQKLLKDTLSTIDRANALIERYEQEDQILAQKQQEQMAKLDESHPLLTEKEQKQLQQNRKTLHNLQAKSGAAKLELEQLQTLVPQMESAFDAFQKAEQAYQEICLSPTLEEREQEKQLVQTLSHTEEFLSKLTDQKFKPILEDKFYLQYQPDETLRPIEALSGGERYHFALSMLLAWSMTQQEQEGLYFLEEEFQHLDESAQTRTIELLKSVSAKGCSFCILQPKQIDEKSLPHILSLS